MQTVLPSASAAAALSRDLDAALADEADEKAPRACIPNARCDSIDATRAAVTLQHVALSRPPVVLSATFQPTTRGQPDFLLKQSLRIANDVPKAKSRQQNLTCQSRPCWCFQWSRCRPLVSANGRAGDVDPADERAAESTCSWLILQQKHEAHPARSFPCCGSG